MDTKTTLRNSPKSPKTKPHSPNKAPKAIPQSQAPSKKGKKRRMADQDPDPLLELKSSGVRKSSFSPFLVISPNDNSKIDSLSIFKLSRGLKSLDIGKPRTVERYHSTRSLMVEVNGREECTKLMDCTLFCGKPVTVEPHKRLNRSKGVIKSRDLVGCTPEEMVEELESVVEARRVSIRRGNDTILTNTWILTFDSTRPPSRIQIEYLNLEVRPYVQNPMRCFNCHRFGHTKTNCRRRAVVCSRCGKDGHSEEGCKASFRCLNCQGEHSAASKECERWRQEKAILTYKATHGGTFAQAKAVVIPSSLTASKADRSFADAVKSGVDKKSTTRKNTESRIVKEKTLAKPSRKTSPKKLDKKGAATCAVNLFAVLADEGVEPAVPATPTSTAAPIPTPPSTPQNPIPLPTLLPSPRPLMEMMTSPGVSLFGPQALASRESLETQGEVFKAPLTSQQRKRSAKNRRNPQTPKGSPPTPKKSPRDPSGSRTPQKGSKKPTSPAGSQISTARSRDPAEEPVPMDSSVGSQTPSGGSEDPTDPKIKFSPNTKIKVGGLKAGCKPAFLKN